MVGGIGGPGGSGPPGKVGGIGGAQAPATSASTGAKFGDALVEKTGKSSASSPLEQLRAGELDLKGYVEVRVREATAHLEGVLSPKDLEKVQDELRDAIENDPDIAALVKGAEIGR